MPGPQASAFSEAVASLSPDELKTLSNSIFFPDGESFRKAAQKGEETKPVAKNTFNWFRPDVEAEVYMLSQKWVSQPKFRAVLEKMWDEAPTRSDGRKDTTLHNAYDDKETFIQRNLRFLAGDFKNAFYTPIARAVGWNPSGGERKNGDEGVRLTGDADWDKFAKEETAVIRQQALEWLKGRVG